MATALPKFKPSDSDSGKRDFAKRVRGFVNRTRALPGLMIYAAVGIAAVLILSVAGGFGTGAMPLPRRLVFWSLLVGWNIIAWIAWLSWRVRAKRDWWPAVMWGIPILNLPIPLEIRFAVAATGGGAARGWATLWAQSAMISAAILLVMAVALRRRHTSAAPAAEKGRLWREGFRDPQALLGIAAEDHYCRLYHRDCPSRLIHARFGDLIKEAIEFDGTVVRRGQWVAASAVKAIARDGRRWRVTLNDGRSILASAEAASRLRALGWLG